MSSIFKRLYVTAGPLRLAVKLGAWAVAGLTFAQPSALATPGAQSSLAIVDAGVQQAEDTPFLPTDYRFLPGEFVYFSFQVAGFSIKSEDSNEARRISLSYEITPEDSKGIALTPPNTGAVQVALNPEDKNWMPKRRVSFLLPSFIAAGEYRIHAVIKDLFAKSEISKDFPFRVGGIKIEPSDTLTAENVRFFRNENDREPLELPAYRPGDSIYVSFDMVGYKLGPGNAYHVAYGLTVLRPDGKPFITQPNAAELNKTSFYPAQFVPGSLKLTTSSDSSRGEYVIVLTVRDLIGNQTYETRQAFSLE